MVASVPGYYSLILQTKTSRLSVSSHSCLSKRYNQRWGKGRETQEIRRGTLTPSDPSLSSSFQHFCLLSLSIVN